MKECVVFLAEAHGKLRAEGGVTRPVIPQESEKVKDRKRPASMWMQA
jgi:hypothetical protein